MGQTYRLHHIQSKRNSGLFEKKYQNQQSTGQRSYKALVRSVLELSQTVWDPHTSRAMKKRPLPEDQPPEFIGLYKTTNSSVYHMLLIQM